MAPVNPTFAARMRMGAILHDEPAEADSISGCFAARRDRQANNTRRDGPANGAIYNEAAGGAVDVRAAAQGSGLDSNGALQTGQVAENNVWSTSHIGGYAVPFLSLPFDNKRIKKEEDSTAIFDEARMQAPGPSRPAHEDKEVRKIKAKAPAGKGKGKTRATSPAPAPAPRDGPTRPRTRAAVRAENLAVAVALPEKGKGRAVELGPLPARTGPRTRATGARKPKDVAALKAPKGKRKAVIPPPLPDSNTAATGSKRARDRVNVEDDEDNSMPDPGTSRRTRRKITAPEPAAVAPTPLAPLLAVPQNIENMRQLRSRYVSKELPQPKAPRRRRAQKAVTPKTAESSVPEPQLEQAQVVAHVPVPVPESVPSAATDATRPMQRLKRKRGDENEDENEEDSSTKKQRMFENGPSENASATSSRVDGLALSLSVASEEEVENITAVVPLIASAEQDVAPPPEDAVPTPPVSPAPAGAPVPAFHHLPAPPQQQPLRRTETVLVAGVLIRARDRFN